MPKISKLTLATLMFAAVPATLALAQDDGRKAKLAVGSPAPALHVAEWVQGDKVEAFAKDHVYVVEFWATWCGPCRAIIPHMSQLNTKYADQPVTFIGVDIWEDDPAAVRKFVKQMGDKMNYNIAIDEGGEKGETAKAWMNAAGQTGIPTAFIVGRDGTIKWIGHPGQIDQPLAAIVAGNFDPEKEADLAEQRRRIERQMIQAQRNGDFEKMLKLIDELAEINPDFAAEAGVFRFHMLLQLKRYDDAYKLAAELADGPHKDDAGKLNEISWTILDEEGLDRRDYPLALRVARRAVEVSESKDGAILDTLARAYFDTGKIAEAVKYQRLAVQHATDDDRDELEDTLKRYEEATQVN